MCLLQVLANRHSHTQTHTFTMHKQSMGGLFGSHNALLTPQSIKGTTAERVEAPQLKRTITTSINSSKLAFIGDMIYYKDKLFHPVFSLPFFSSFLLLVSLSLLCRTGLM